MERLSSLLLSRRHEPVINQDPHTDSSGKLRRERSDSFDIKRTSPARRCRAGDRPPVVLHDFHRVAGWSTTWCRGDLHDGRIRPLVLHGGHQPKSPQHHSEPFCARSNSGSEASGRPSVVDPVRYHRRTLRSQRPDRDRTREHEETQSDHRPRRVGLAKRVLRTCADRSDPAYLRPRTLVDPPGPRSPARLRKSASPLIGREYATVRLTCSMVDSVA